MGRPMKKPETKSVTDKEIVLDEVILEYLNTKDDNYGNTNVFFKVANPNTVDGVMKIDTRLPMWAGQDDDIVIKVKAQNVNTVFILERRNLYESIINLVKYSFQPKDKKEVLEGYTAKILKLKLYNTNI